MVNNSLVASQEKEMKTMSSFLTQDIVKRKINEMIGSERGTRFIAAVSSAVATNPALQECTQSSILNAALVGESLNLSPSPQLGHYYMVPYNNKKLKCKIAEFEIGYKGYIQLAIRSGYYKDLDVIEIRDGEYIGRDKVTGKHKFEFIEDDSERENKKVIGYLAYFEYLTGFTKSLYWSKEKMINHADTYSPAFSKEATSGDYAKVSYKDFEAGKVQDKDMWKYSSFWYTNFDGMAFKTMIRQLISKWGIMSVEMQKAFSSDMAYIQDNGQPVYIEKDVIEVPNSDINNTNQQPITTEDTHNKQKIPDSTVKITNSKTVNETENIQEPIMEVTYDKENDYEDPFA